MVPGHPRETEDCLILVLIGFGGLPQGISKLWSRLLFFGRKGPARVITDPEDHYYLDSVFLYITDVSDIPH